MRKLIKFATKWLIAPVTLAFIAVFVFLMFIRYPEPITAYQLATAVPSEQPELFKTNQIPASSEPYLFPVSDIPETLPQTINHEGTEFDTQTLIDDTGTHALVVMRGGVITYEYYAEGWDESRQQNVMSVGKTMLSMAVGQLVDQGLIRENDSITDHLPQFEDNPGMEDVTIKHLLDMQSCLDIPEDYPPGPEGWFTPVAQLFATTDVEYVLENNISFACQPGSEEYEYRSANSQLLGMVFKSVTGESLSEFFAENIWEPIGANHEASWAIDQEDGYEKSFCCFNASARDLALAGSVFLNSGQVAYGPNTGQTVLSENWFGRMTTPAGVWFGGFGSEDFGAGMWHKPKEQLVSQGYRGQFIWINPYTDTVIVKLSDDFSDYYEQTVTMLDQISFGN